MEKIIYTIGHSNYTIETFYEMIKKYSIDIIVDVRGTPYSKYNIQYNRNVIGENLKNYGVKYMYMGQEFGAQREKREYYIQEGYADFKKVVKDKNFIEGIKRLEVGIERGYTIGLLGAKQNPIECHRFVLVARELQKYGIKVFNITHEGDLKSNWELEEELIDRYFNRNDLNFYNILEGEKNREEYLRESLEKMNREIGFRLEKLKEKGYKL